MKTAIAKPVRTIFWLIATGAVVLMIPKAWYLAVSLTICWIAMKVYSL